MFLPKAYLEQFVEFITTHTGSKVILHESTLASGEVGRFMWGETFVVIRTFSPSAGEEAEMLEVWASSPHKRDELERMWGFHIQSLMNTEIQETDHVPESGDETSV
jgi:hypothetical protein